MESKDAVQEVTRVEKTMFEINQINNPKHCINTVVCT